LIWICGLKHQKLYLLDEDFITFLMYNGFLNFENGFCLMRVYLLMDPVSCLSNKKWYCLMFVQQKMILSHVCPTKNDTVSCLSNKKWYCLMFVQQKMILSHVCSTKNDTVSCLFNKKWYCLMFVQQWMNSVLLLVQQI
jgi:hypothetical protein